MELFNESIVCFAFLQLYMFTEWGPDEEIKYLVGWLVVEMVAIFSLINLGIVLKEIIKASFLTSVKYYRIAEFAC